MGVEWVPVADSRAAAMERCFGDVDWSASPLGPRDGWPDELTCALDLILESPFPSALYWGPEFAVIYNDAFTTLIADKHPAALGAPARQVFAEAWEQLRPLMEGVLDGRGTVSATDTLVPLERHGFLEECYFDFAYSPARDEAGEAVGIVVIASEATAKVVALRRLELLNGLGESLADASDPADMATRLQKALLAVPEEFLDIDIRLPGTPGPLRLPGPSAPLVGPAVDTIDGLHLAWVPLRPGTTGEGVLTLTRNPALPDALDDLPFLGLLSEVVSRAVVRLDAHAVEQRAVLAERRLSEDLQRSLLTQPVVPDLLDVAVRYEPAADRAKVGGDWYDAFTLPGGDLAVVIGDVAGHDSLAASVMAQARNLLRGIACATEGDPAAVLSLLDATLLDLGVEHLITAVLARLTPTPEGHRVTWSNAGHLPPVVRRRDGSVEVLQRPASMLLGLEPTTARLDHGCVLAEGDQFVLYTDGLVERRDWGIDDGIAWLAAAVADTEAVPSAVCDRLMATMPPAAEDDVALLVVESLATPLTA